MTTRRVRHGIVLALAGLLAGLGIVATLFWDGDVPPFALNGTPEPPSGAAKPPTLADIPATRPGGEVRDPSGQTSPDRPPASPVAPGQDAPAGPSAAPGRTTQGQAAAPGDQAALPPSTAAPDKTAAASDAPRFDIVRVEPNGDAVIAGRGKPNTVVEMLVDGQPVARALTDPTGQFAIVPPPLPKGSSEIVLRSRSADGSEARSAQSIAVSIAPKGDMQPLVALTSPDAPTVVLSQPGSVATAQAPGGGPSGSGAGSPSQAGAQARTTQPEPAPAQSAQAQVAPLRIVSVDAEPTGRLYISGVGIGGTEVRLYLNDTLITPAKVGADGRVTFTIGRGISPGRYKVRVEEVDPATGKVAHRAEVAFVMPEPVVAQATEARQAAHAPADVAHAGKPDKTSRAPETGGRPATPSPPAPGDERPGGPAPGMPGEMAATTARSGGDAQADRPGAVYVPEITTAKITRGDSLWQISKRTYGRGRRYTVIYDANQDQIRDPDLIYPGQTFVLPMERRG